MQKFYFFTRYYTKEYDSFEVEYSEYAPGKDHFVMLYAYDCPLSWAKVAAWNRLSKHFTNVTLLTFG